MTIRCAVCGKIITAKSNRQKYCLDCKKEVLRRQKAEVKKRAILRENFGINQPERVETIDSQEVIDICLSCENPICKGKCRKIIGRISA